MTLMRDDRLVHVDEGVTKWTVSLHRHVLLVGSKHKIYLLCYSRGIYDLKCYGGRGGVLLREIRYRGNKI